MFFLRLDERTKSNLTLIDAVRNNFLQSDKCTAADEQNIFRVDIDETLLRMLASPFRRNAGNRAFEDFQ